MKTTQEILNWRYATKSFDSGRKLSGDQLQIVKDALRLSASSFGLQPWGFVIVSDSDVKEELLPVSFNQSQVVDASHVIVLCLRTGIDDDYIHTYIESIAEERDVSMESLLGYESTMKGFLKGKDEASMEEWSRRQVYLALGSLLTVCAYEEIDACPMEGFSRDDYDSILDLPSKGLKSVVVCPVGFRSPDDAYQNDKKVRFGEDQIFF